MAGILRTAIAALLARLPGTLEAKRPDDDGVTFYFFDFDDNIMRLATPIVLKHCKTGAEREISTEDFAAFRKARGADDPYACDPDATDDPKEWRNYAMFDGSFRYFEDIPPEEIEDGERQYFVRDVAAAIAVDGTGWQAPSWAMFRHACAAGRPVSIITARGHARETIRAGLAVLKEAGLIEATPNYLTIYAVGDADTRKEIIAEIDDPAERARIESLADPTSDLKRWAIRQTVEAGLVAYGAGPPHRFGMSDDDPKNVSLIVKAMCDCKTRYMDKRFFVIDTHKDEHVKLEVFPADHPVTGRRGVSNAYR